MMSYRHFWTCLPIPTHLIPITSSQPMLLPPFWWRHLLKHSTHSVHAGGMACFLTLCSSLLNYHLLRETFLTTLYQIATPIFFPSTFTDSLEFSSPVTLHTDLSPSPLGCTYFLKEEAAGSPALIQCIANSTSINVCGVEELLNDNLHNNSLRYSYPNFIGEETKVQKSILTAQDDKLFNERMGLTQSGLYLLLQSHRLLHSGKGLPPWLE